MDPNPFTPTFGVTPPVLVGRQSIIREAEEALIAADLAARLGMSAPNVAQYRSRLIDEGMIEAAGHGLVRFTTPLLREFIRDQSHETA